MRGGVDPGVVEVVVVVVAPGDADGEIERTIKKVAPTKSTTITRTMPREGW